MIGKIKVKPHAKRRGWLRNANSPGDLTKAPRCGAKTRKGTPCRAPAMRNGRCRLHGGKSTGPRTQEGIERIRKAHLKHSRYTREAIVARKEFDALLKALRGTIKDVSLRYGDIEFKI